MSLSASCSHLGTSKGLRNDEPSSVLLPQTVRRMKCINVLPRYSSKTGYETLHHLVRRANVWLTQHKSWEVRTCESLPFETKVKTRVTGPSPVSQLSTMRRSAPDIFFADHITYLRLWVIKMAMPRYMGHRITVYTVLPKPSHAEDGSLQFTNLSSLLEDINSTLRHTWPSNFEILTVETLQSTFDRYEDSAETLTTAGLRIFVGFFDAISNPSSSEIESRTISVLVNGISMYQEFPTVCEKIGIADFAPERLQDGSLEKFSDLVARASKRCSARSDIRITNIQAVDIRLSSDGFMDTTKTYHYEDSQSTFVRIVRVAFVTRRPSGAHDLALAQSNSCWSCRHFYPQMRGLVAKNLETIEQVVGRMNAWLAQHKGEFISAESYLIPVDPCRPWWEEIEKQEIGNMNEQQRRLANWLCVIRLYVTNSILDLRDTEPKEIQPTGFWSIFTCFSGLFTSKKLFKDTCSSCQPPEVGEDLRTIREASKHKGHVDVEAGVKRENDGFEVQVLAGVPVEVTVTKPQEDTH